MDEIRVCLERGGIKTETGEHPRSRGWEEKEESEKEWPERDVREDPVEHLVSKFLEREWPK